MKKAAAKQALSARGLFGKSRMTDLLLAMLAGLIAVVVAGFPRMDPQTPLQPREDFLGALFNIKSLALFGTITKNPDVAFPLGGDFSAFPIVDILSLAVARGALVFTSSIFEASFFYLATCFFLVAAASFFCWRSLRFSRWLSFCGATLVAVSPFMIARAPVHPYFCMIAVLPWVVRFCLLLFYQRPRLSQPPFKIGLRETLVLGILAGSSGLYPAFFTTFFLAVAALLVFIGAWSLPDRATKWRRAMPALGAILVLGLVFVAWLAPHLWAMMLQGGTLPTRHILEQAHYGLRLPDLLIPDVPPFRTAYRAFSAAQAAMTAEGNAPAGSLWSVLGLWGGLVLLVLRLAKLDHTTRFWNQRRALMAHAATGLAVAGILFAMPYGLGLIFNMYISAMIRAQVRVAVFVMILGTVLGLIFAMRRERSTRPALFTTATLLLLTASLWPQLDALKSYQDRHLSSWQETKAAYARVLQELDANNLLHIAQIPSYYYPEGPATPSFSNTEHLTPYLLDTNRARRWSFGSMLGQDLWKKLAALSLDDPTRFDAALGCMGYDAVLIEKRAIPRPQMEIIQRYIASVAPTRILLQTPTQTLIAHPPKPTACP